MHIPDGFINASTSAGAGVVAAGGIATCLRRARQSLEERTGPLAGLVAAFIFALQMLNFPVAAGTSGHLLGGVLAAVLVGPWVGALCVSVVLIVQALVFADGGLSALGLNIINMALVGALCCYPLFLVLRRLLGNQRRGLVVAAAITAWFGPVVASLVFAAEYAVGGNHAASTSRVVTAMVGTHALIGIGEAVITGAVLSAVMAVRPDLVHGARTRRAVAGDGRGRVGSIAARPLAPVVVGVLALAGALVFLVAPKASSKPDGLQKIAADNGLDAGVRPTATSASPLAGYGVHGLGNSTLATGVAGAAGIGGTFLIALGATRIRRRRRAHDGCLAEPLDELVAGAAVAVSASS